MEHINLTITKDFSSTPGPRYIHEGEHSGEKFRKEILFPRLKKVIEGNLKLLIDLDGTAGYGTSFLEESFGGLIREEHLTYDLIKTHIEIKSIEEPYLLDDIEHYLTDAANQPHPAS